MTDVLTLGRVVPVGTDLVEPEAADGLRNLLKMSERSSRGARVDPAMGAWVREEGVSLLLSLDLMLPS